MSFVEPGDKISDFRIEQEMGSERERLDALLKATPATGRLAYVENL